MRTILEVLGVWRTALDGSDAETEGVWISSTGVQVSFLQWNPKEPNGGETANCLIFNRELLMMDHSCSAMVSVICERPLKIGKLLLLM